jgi:uncharacterized protein (DUF983 family)
MTDSDHSSQDDRPLKPALLRGFKERCPACGDGRILHRYLKIHEHCPSCGETLSHARADDGPAYLTILVVGHLMGFILHFLWGTWRMDPLTMSLVASAIAVSLSLLLLPRFKGMLVGLQWAKRMHGF